MSPAGVRVTRPKGFYPWKPHPPTLKLMGQVQNVLDQYRDFLPLTLRQVFYALVGQYDFPKREKDYKRLGEYLVRARRSGMIPFGSIRDDGGIAQGDSGYDDFAQFWESERDAAAAYARDRMGGQPVTIELWCETSGMVPQLARVASPYHVSVRSAQLGFASITLTRQIAERALREDRPTVFMHVGDFDPSGQSIYEAMAEDAGLFIEQLRGERGQAGAMLMPERVALTAGQVDEYDLPTAPPKESDTRSRNWEGETCQAEAMPPDTLATIVEAAIREHIDLDERARVMAEEEREREQAKRTIGTMLHGIDPTRYPFKYDGPSLGGYFTGDDDE